ncbi:MAG: 16S rRNA (guanine(966)-N(2))-methyltransferase RsmD [Slackia faecicanis]|nr:16S rRNA (guanine(966)-N(2))-methyltransferase RsmD [Slackia faecicanis]
MRVIAGLYKGRPLSAPKGSSTRPTTDRVKESLMSSLISAYGPIEGARVLDAFAGSGALGIECLSRGAASAHFFERDKNALAALRSNVDMLGLPADRARIFRADVMKNPPLAGGSAYDIVFLDPPYAFTVDEVYGLMAALREGGRLSADAVVSYERDASCDLAAFFAERGVQADILASKRFSKTVIDLFRFL